MALVVITIYNAGDPSYRFRIPADQKEYALGKLPEWVLARVQHPTNLRFKWGDPVGVLCIDAPWQIDELLQF